MSLCKNDEVQPEPQSMLSCIYKNCNIQLFYQPYYWMVGHENSINAKYLRTEIGEKSFSRTAAGNGFKPSNHKYSNRVPDITIEVTRPTGESFLLVLDAKYSTMETAFRDRLRECGMKYIHGIHGVNGTSPVIAMILISPTEKAASLADMHAPPYGVFDNKTVFPILGVQGVNLMPNKESNFDIKDTIKRVLDLIVDTDSHSKTINLLEKQKIPVRLKEIS